jgi:hypothetical protein
LHCPPRRATVLLAYLPTKSILSNFCLLLLRLFSQTPIVQLITISKNASSVIQSEG